MALISAGGCSSGEPEAATGGTLAGSGATPGAGGLGGPVGSGGIAGSGGGFGTGGDGITGGAPGDGAAPGSGGASGGMPGVGAAPGSGGTPMGGGGTMTGSGGMMMEPEPEVCEDVAPPVDPEWPDATCESWRYEADACGEDWFADYCDVTCERCMPDGGSNLPEPPDCTGENLPNVSGGEGHATRYWDCCQTHCAQFNGHKCSADGVSSTGDNVSSCQGGGSYACYDEAPRAVSNCLAYGHIAKANPNCGSCYRIQFTGQGEHNANDIGSMLIQGKQMIVKVTNTGSDVGGNQFDLMVPGGGVGLFNACSQQWNANDLGAQYGGYLSECSGTHAQKKECVRQKCSNIPAGSARDGCLWFVDWFQIADNPKFTSTPTDCPF